MRRLYTLQDVRTVGLTEAMLRTGMAKGSWHRATRGVFVKGPIPPTTLERAVGEVVATGGAASGCVAGVLLGLDSVAVSGPDVTVPRASAHKREGVRRRDLADDRITVVEGIRCTNGLQTLLDLAAMLDDREWEHALESALRRRLTSPDELRTATAGVRGAGRIRRVLALRPPGVQATESLLETLMVQLARTVPGLGEPVRQYVVLDADGRFIARVDLAWPEIGLFLELDGRHHEDQPEYDARRETAVVAATGWLPGRFTWREVVTLPAVTARRLAALAEQARQRSGGGILSARG